MTTPASYVLIIETDAVLRSDLAALFESEGFEVVVEEADADASAAQVLARNPSVIIMSELVPPLDGLELLPLLRRLTQAPIVVIGEGGETAVVNALLQGADVYLRKPINFRELLSRVRALLRRSEMDSSSYSFMLWPLSTEEVTTLAEVLSSVRVFGSHLWSRLPWWRHSARGQPCPDMPGPIWWGQWSYWLPCVLTWGITGVLVLRLAAARGGLRLLA